MVLKYMRYWDTGSRQTSLTSVSLSFKPTYIAASGDTIVLTENLGEEGHAFLKIICKKYSDEWSLPIDGKILRCTISRNLIVILLVQGQTLSKRMEVYDSLTHHRLVSRRLGANPRIFVDAPYILLRHFNSTSHIASEEIEVVDMNDAKKSFRYPLNEINCSKIICFSFPHIILHSIRRRKIYLKIVEQQSKTIKDVHNFDFDTDNTIRDCAFKEEHIFLILHDTYSLSRLSVLNKDGERICEVRLNFHQWNHGHCGYFILSDGNEMRLHQAKNFIKRNGKEKTLFRITESFEVKDTFVKPEELNKIENVWVMSTHSIKHIKLQSKSIEIQNETIIY